MAQPTLSRRDETARHSSPLPSGELTHNPYPLRDPRHANAFGRQLMRARKINAGRQEPARSHFTGAHELWHGEIHDRRVHTARELDISHSAVGSAKIDTNQV